MGKPQTHVSHVNQFFNCGAQRECYIVQGPVAPGVAAIEGTGTHRPTAKNMEHKKETGELLSEEEIKDLAHDTVIEEWEKTLNYSDGPRLDDDEKEQGVDKIRGKAVDTAISLSLLHHREIAPALKPDRIEWPWVLNLPDEYGHDLAGTIDLQEAGIPGKSNILHELKTTKRPNIENYRDQILMYSMALWKIDGAVPPVSFDWLIKKKTPEARIEGVVVEVADFSPLLRRLEIMWKAEEAGIYLPTGRGTWRCCYKWCGYYPCKYVR